MATERPLRLAIIGAGSRGLTYGRESVATGYILSKLY